MNKNLNDARRNKNDEFYTQLDDIEKELLHYKEHFKDKVIFCNCDDPHKSKFVEFFTTNFKELGLKRLITACYKNNLSKQAMSLDYDGDTKIIKDLKGDGDFRSLESIELLKQADIVITNPPFSLFREYVAQLFKYKKTFIIVGNINAVTYKETFKLILEKKLWIGIKSPKNFLLPNNIIKNLGGVCWYTNIPINLIKAKIPLTKTYNEKDYPKYDNFDAINVDRILDIPKDYEGFIGVPITILDKYNPEQFEIIRFRKGDDNKDLKIKERYPYIRIIIKRKT